MLPRASVAPSTGASGAAKQNVLRKEVAILFLVRAFIVFIDTFMESMRTSTLPSGRLRMGWLAPNISNTADAFARQ